MRLKVPFFRYVLAIAGLLLPSIIFAGLLPSLINAEPVKARLMAELTQWMGAEVTVAGPVSVESLFSLSVDLRDVEFKHVDGESNITGVKAGRLVARINWTDLLTGNLDFDKIKIDDAVIHTGAAGPEDLGAAVLTALWGGHENPFAAFVLTDSVVTSGDPRQPKQVLAITSAVANLRQSDGHVELSGHIGWGGENVRFQMATNIRALAKGSVPVPLNLTLESRLLSGGFNGETRLAEPGSASGHLGLASTDLPGLSKWLKLELAADLPAALQLTGSARISRERLSLQSAAFNFGGQSATGEVTLYRGSGAARLQGALAFDALNFGPIWDAALGERAKPLPADLQSLAIDLRVSAERLRWNAAVAMPAAFTLTANQGVFSAEIAELGLFDGAVLGHLEADLAREPVRVRARLTAENIDMAKTLGLVSMQGGLSGRADARIEVEAHGLGHRQLLETAKGRARISVSDGGSIPLDIAHLANAPPAAGASGWGGPGFAHAAFDELLVQLSLQDGELRCEELNMLSAGDRIDGAGSINLARQELDWHFTIRKTAAQGAGAGVAAKIEPGKTPDARLSIRGPWVRPTIRAGERSGALPAYPAGGADAALASPFQFHR